MLQVSGSKCLYLRSPSTFVYVDIDNFVVPGALRRGRAVRDQHADGQTDTGQNAPEKNDTNHPVP